MNPNRNLVQLVLAGAFVLGACQSSGAHAPAVLDSWDAETMATVKSVLADAMDDASIELGPGDPTEMSTISVLPPRPSPYEDRSTATPTQFDIVIKDDTCFLVRRDSAEEYELDGVSCRPIGR